MKIEVDYLPVFQANTGTAASRVDLSHLVGTAAHKGTAASGITNVRGLDPRIDPPVQPAQEGGEDAGDHAAARKIRRLQGAIGTATTEAREAGKPATFLRSPSHRRGKR